MTAYYSEFDPYAAAWLRNLIAAGLIAPGDVDERDIRDIRPDDLRGYTQCHFFAGIGGWSRALRLAGWADDRPVWTGSCPCQPFSAAGKGSGFADERHLWPAWFHLIRELRPATVLGEQVAGKAVEPWIDLVQSDVEGVGYAFGGVPVPAAGIGSPHIRDRLWWVADASGGLAFPAGAGPQGRAEPGERVDAQRPAAERDGGAGGVADADLPGRSSRREGRAPLGYRAAPEPDCRAGGMADAGRKCGAGWREFRDVGRPPTGDEGAVGERKRLWYTADDGSANDADDPAGPLHGFWRDADWLLCRDGKWRPVEPGAQPLAHGVSARVGKLRAAGNAIVPQVAAEFIGAYSDLFS